MSESSPHYSVPDFQAVRTQMNKVQFLIKKKFISPIGHAFKSIGDRGWRDSVDGQNPDTELDRGSSELDSHSDLSAQEISAAKAELGRKEKTIKAALQYFKVVLAKDFLKKLPGIGTVVLENMIVAMKISQPECFRLTADESDRLIQLRRSIIRSFTSFLLFADSILFDASSEDELDRSSTKVIDDLLSTFSILIEFARSLLAENKLKRSALSDLLDVEPTADSKAGTREVCVSGSSGTDKEAISSTSAGGESKETLHPNVEPQKPPLPSYPYRNFYGNRSPSSAWKSSSQPGLKMNGTVVLDDKRRPASDLVTQYGYSAPHSPIGPVTGRASPTGVEYTKEPSESSWESSELGKPENCSSGGSSDEVRNEVYNLVEDATLSVYHGLSKHSLSLQALNATRQSSVEDPEPPDLPVKRRQKASINQYVEVYARYSMAETSTQSSTNDYGLHFIGRIDEEETCEGLRHDSVSGTQRDTPDQDDPESALSSLGASNELSTTLSSGSDEEDPSTSEIMYREDHGRRIVQGGTAVALIKKAVDSGELDPSFYQAFLMTYRTFQTPGKLISRLILDSNSTQRRNPMLASKYIQLLVDVIGCLYEELDQQLFDMVRTTLHQLLKSGNLVQAYDLRATMISYCAKLHIFLEHSKIGPMTTIPEHCDYELFLEADYKDIAKQMTFLDEEYFCRIQLPELLSWSKEQNEDLSPNLTLFTAHFNSQSYWCRTMLVKLPRQHDKEKAFLKLLKIMKFCRKINNFSSYLAILTALDSGPVRKFKWPRDMLTTLEDGTSLIDSSSAFKNYRKAFAEVYPCCIPYLGIVLQDLTFIQNGNPDNLPGGKVNFLKRWHQHDILSKVRQCQQHKYGYPANEEIIHFLNDYRLHLGEDPLWNLVDEMKGK